jgi:hypothetical protein
MPTKKRNPAAGDDWARGSVKQLAPQFNSATNTAQPARAVSRRLHGKRWLPLTEPTALSAAMLRALRRKGGAA